MRIYKSFVLAVAFIGTSRAQPAFRINDGELPASPVMIAYGDTRFTDPAETTGSNPKVRRWLVDRIAAERPNVLLLIGDLPWHGQVENDYAVFKSETAPWRAANIFVSVTLGNHELNGDDPQKCLENWWNTFPKVRGYRWYSVEFGSKVLILNLDSDAPLLPGSEQRSWIERQLASISPSVKFVFFSLHHPPIADIQAPPYDDHNPRPNEIALADFLKTVSARNRTRFIVTSGHIHNYERFVRDEVVYLVSGGGGAPPRIVQRGPDDLYKDAPEVNYHYVKFVLNGSRLDVEMVRVANPSAGAPDWQVKDRFKITAR